MKKVIIGVIILCIIGGLIVILRGNNPQKTVTQASEGTYVAMGDSVAAGVGLMGDSDSSACDRTNQSYPNQVAAALHYTLKNLSCSGATLPEGILGSQDVNKLQETPQLQALFTQPKPTLITLTIGANDAQWTTVISKCYTGECGSAADTASVDANLVTVATNLQTVLKQIQTHYGTSVPHVIVTGYHQVFPTSVTPNCSDLSGIDASELAWGQQLQTHISTTLQNAIQGYSFAAFVPVNFSGHELCTSNPWVQGLSDTQPYHPTDLGQAEYAKEIIAAVKKVQ